MGDVDLPGARRRFDELLGSVFGSRPTKAMIEIADRCNESCVHCYQIQGQKGEMASEDIFAILDDLARAGVFLLTLSGGEATLRSDFLDIVRYARRRDFAITLYTNGILIDDAMADELAAIGIRRVEISLYGVEPEVHDWVTNVPGSWEKSIAAVRRLTCRGIPVRIKTPQMAPNTGMWDAYHALAMSLGADATISPALMAREDGSRFPEQLQSDDEATKELLPKLQHPARDPAFDRSQRKPCGAAQNLHIEPNGELRPCTMLDVPLGDAREGAGVVHQTSEVGRALRELRWQDLPGCATCALAHHCNRCHAQSLREVGDALAPYPSACHSALLNWELQTDQAAELPGRGETLVGPFAIEDGVLTLVEAPALTEAQQELYSRHEWLRRSVEPAQPRVATGELVQLRRPGRRPKAERVPRSRAQATSNE